MQEVGARLDSHNVSVFSSDSSDRDWILAQIPPYQVFFMDTHANSSTIGDCLGDGEHPEHFIWFSEIASAVAQKTSSQPNYWFVHLEGCHTCGMPDPGDPDPAFANSFDVASWLDRALFGWRTYILINEFNRAWNQHFWDSLMATHTVYEAYHDTVATYGVKQGPDDEHNGIALGWIFGDSSTKVHGVYAGALGQWYR